MKPETELVIFQNTLSYGVDTFYWNVCSVEEGQKLLDALIDAKYLKIGFFKKEHYTILKDFKVQIENNDGALIQDFRRPGKVRTVRHDEKNVFVPIYYSTGTTRTGPM